MKVVYTPAHLGHELRRPPRSEVGGGNGCQHIGNVDKVDALAGPCPEAEVEGRHEGVGE